MTISRAFDNLSPLHVEVKHRGFAPKRYTWEIRPVQGLSVKESRIQYEFWAEAVGQAKKRSWNSLRALAHINKRRSVMIKGMTSGCGNGRDARSAYRWNLCSLERILALDIWRQPICLLQGQSRKAAACFIRIAERFMR